MKESTKESIFQWTCGPAITVLIVLFLCLAWQWRERQFRNIKHKEPIGVVTGVDVSHSLLSGTRTKIKTSSGRVFNETGSIPVPVGAKAYIVTIGTGAKRFAYSEPIKIEED